MTDFVEMDLAKEANSKDLANSIIGTSITVLLNSSGSPREDLQVNLKNQQVDLPRDNKDEAQRLGKNRRTVRTVMDIDTLGYRIVGHVRPRQGGKTIRVVANRLDHMDGGIIWTPID